MLGADAAGAKERDDPRAGRACRSDGRTRAKAPHRGGRSLGRPDDARDARRASRARGETASPRRPHAQARLRGALERPRARLEARPGASDPCAERIARPRADRRPLPSRRAARRDRRQDRRRPAVRRGADDVAARVGRGRAGGGTLRVHRRGRRRVGAGHAARLADGAPRPSRACEGDRTDRRRDRPGVQLRASRRRVVAAPGRPRAAGGAAAGVRPHVSAGGAARRDLQLQACARARRRLRHAPAQPSQGAPREDRARARGALARGRRDRPGAARPPLHRRRRGRRRRPLLGAGRRGRARAVRRLGGGGAPVRGPGAGREPPAGARIATYASSSCARCWARRSSLSAVGRRRR